MSRATMTITLPLESDEPIPLDDAMALWTALVRTAFECGFNAAGAHVDYEGFEP